MTIPPTAAVEVATREIIMDENDFIRIIGTRKNVRLTSTEFLVYITELPRVDHTYEGQFKFLVSPVGPFLLVRISELAFKYEIHLFHERVLVDFNDFDE